jgi:ligand-binding sensor domain-containing protein
VWTANLSDILISGSGNSGAVGLGLNATSPFFAKITSGVDPAGGLGSVQCIGGNSNEIWAYAAVNYGRSQILRYNAGAQGLITTIGTYDNLNTPALTSNFSVRGIYFDPSDNRWIGMATGGMVVKVGSSWHTINYPNIFPAGTAVNINAVTGNKQGKVFIGTTNGLVIYNGIGPVTDSKAFTRLTSLEGLPNTNVRSVCYDEENKRLVLATFGGIMIIKY